MGDWNSFGSNPDAEEETRIRMHGTVSQSSICVKCGGKKDANTNPKCFSCWWGSSEATNKADYLLRTPNPWEEIRKLEQRIKDLENKLIDTKMMPDSRFDMIAERLDELEHSFKFEFNKRF